MTHDWLDEGLRQKRQREEQHRLASERRLHQAAVIKDKAPDLMRQLVAAVGTVVDEYRQRAHVGSDEISSEVLPREGFRVVRTTFPRVSLECRPGYETHVLSCNMTRTDDHESAPQELVFSLSITTDDSDNPVMRHETVTFQSLDEVLQFLLKPVLFPELDPDS